MKNILKNLFSLTGYEIQKKAFLPGQRIGLDPFSDILYFLKENQMPLVLDIGANEGQTVFKIQKIIPNAIIHSFEPNQETYQILKEKINHYKSVTAWNFGIGSECSNLDFNESTLSSMSSFLPSTEETWGSVKQVSKIEVQTLDYFIARNNIKIIDLLKIDTQGFEYEVLVGAKTTLQEKRIKLIYLEVIMGGMYKNLPSLSSILSLLERNNFSVVAFYDQHHEYPKGTLHWCDILFINKEAALKL
jgi:FkbM family methyltransferase